MNMKYTAINIGPIISTLMLARKPRELWSASYLFSHLMRCVIDSLPSDCRVISPAILKGDDLKLGVGLYPDRVFIEGYMTKKVKDIFADAWESFCESTVIKKINDKSLSVFSLKENYFNLMSTFCNANSETEAIRTLNAELDKLELINYALDEEDRTPVLNLIKLDSISPLFSIATQDARMPVESLGEIAATEKSENGEIWKKFRNILLDEEKKALDPYVEVFGLDYKSYHKYICVVQADGDNVGKTVSHKDLPDGQVGRISKELLEFGKKAKAEIEAFGGLPIYAGGDDLLFIAPVVGKNHTTIFDLLEAIDDECFNGVAKAINDMELRINESGMRIKASLSYGISISYYKYPLYEAFAEARHQLFDIAKNIDNKNAVAWKYRKHSGSSFEVAFSKGNKNLTNVFKELIINTSDGNVVSAVAHKIRANELLVSEVLKSGKSVRLDALFEKLLECTDTAYFKSVKKIMPILYTTIDKKKYGKTLYNILRTAKFIKGEEPIDE